MGAEVQTLDGRLYVIGGASRCGKTAWTRQHVERSGIKRGFVWDIEDQWSKLKGYKRVTSRAELMREAMEPGPKKIAYVAGGKIKDEFEYFAQCVFYSAKHVQEPQFVIAEEMADVSNPGKALAEWGIVVRRSLKRSTTLYAISQRWSEADKTAVGNASMFVVFMQSSADDVRYLSKKTRIPMEEIDLLQKLEYVTFDTDSKKIERGKLSF